MENRKGRNSKLGWGPWAKRPSALDGLCKLVMAKETISGAGIGSRPLTQKTCVWSKRSQQDIHEALSRNGAQQMTGGADTKPFPGRGTAGAEYPNPTM